VKRLFTSTLLTVAAVPFLMAAPNAAKKAQNTATSSATTTTKKVHKKHAKKNHASGKTVSETASTSNKK
jgi:hypothetical protein